jgi:hypothetical protein
LDETFTKADNKHSSDPKKKVLDEKLTEPGTQGTPELCIASIAATLSPITQIFSARGPIKINPLSS